MLLYTATGDHFSFGGRMTWSIEPDGTSFGGATSNLVSTLDADLGPQSSWLPVIQDAFAEWEAVANVNFAQVPDGGQPLGYGNIQQGSPNFGDIRIGGMAQSSNILAFSLLPPSANGGSESGDIFFNTGQPWHVGSDYDFETVLVHEIGHALGLGESAVPSAVMYEYYGGVQPFPNTDDIAGAQSIWGPRQEDAFEQSNGDLTMANAVNLNPYVNPNSYQIYAPGLDVVSPSESYWFKVTTPSNASNVFTAEAQSTSLSELSPRVQIFAASGVGLAQASAPASAYGATTYATITNATPNTTYYVRVLGSNNGDSGSGSYALLVNMGYGYLGTAPPPNTLVYAQPSQGGGYSLMAVGGLGSWIKEQTLSGESLGGTRDNTPVEIPDPISIGSITVQASLIMSPSANDRAVKNPRVLLNIPHPAAQVSIKISGPNTEATNPAKL